MKSADSEKNADSGSRAGIAGGPAPTTDGNQRVSVLDIATKLNMEKSKKSAQEMLGDVSIIVIMLAFLSLMLILFKKFSGFGDRLNFYLF